jgi:hypothetical protein
MPPNYRLFFTKNSDNDRQRVEAYLEELETKQRRLFALAQGTSTLPSKWKFCPYFDRAKGIRVKYIENWYSVFFSVDEDTRRIIIIGSSDSRV